MTNTRLLRKTIQERGLKYKFLSEQVGLTPFGLSKKINGESEFKASEIIILSEILGLTNDQRSNIFFASDSELQSTKETENV